MKMVWLGRDNCFQVYNFIISNFMLCVVSIFYFLHFYIFQYYEHFYVLGFRIKIKKFTLWIENSFFFLKIMFYKIKDNLRVKFYEVFLKNFAKKDICLLYTSPSPRDKRQSRMPSSA